MDNKAETKVSKGYLFIVLLLMFFLPLLSTTVECWCSQHSLPLIPLAGKWFLFWAIGVRLFTAGFKQALNPSFTAQDIFHLTDKQSFVVVRELGFANICMGSVAIISLFVPQWRMAAAFCGGLYMGIAGAMHIVKKPVSGNEWVALVSDVFIGLVMMGYIISSYCCVSTIR